MIHENSRQAYKTVDKETKQKIILKAVRKLKKCTRQSLASHLDWEINRVTGRVSELIQQGKLKENGSVKVNGRNRAYIEVV